MTVPILRIVAFILGMLGVALVPPFATALACGETASAWAFAIPLAFSLPLTAAARIGRRRETERTIDPASAFVAVGCAWVAIGLFGAVPFSLSGAFPGVTDAVFESVSGFTTTGASVLSDVESLPRSVSLWRCETHWLGGMGVITLAVALVPLLGVGGFRLVKAETTGPEKGKVTARIMDTAKALWVIYVGFTALEAGLLMLAGLGFFDAVCHAFSTLGTGGFSTRNASVGAFGSARVEWICTAFMLVASVNFALYFRLFTGRVREMLFDSELRAFLLLVAVAILAVTLVELPEYGSFGRSLRYSAFQVASVVSTTGFMSADYAAWRPAAQLLLAVLFMVGGCSGSTAGGVKVVRWTILAKQLRNDFRRILHPHEVVTLRLNGASGREDFVPVVASFVLAYVLLVLATGLAGTLAGLGVTEAFTASMSMVGNVGPAFGALGPTANYGALPAWLKWFYSLAMLAGRLEIYTMLVLMSFLVRTAKDVPYKMFLKLPRRAS